MCNRSNCADNEDGSLRKEGFDKNYSREEKGGERTGGGADMSGSNSLFNKYSEYPSFPFEKYVITTYILFFNHKYLLSQFFTSYFFLFLNKYSKSGTLVLPTEGSARMWERRSLVDLMEHDFLFQPDKIIMKFVLSQSINETPKIVDSYLSILYLSWLTKSSRSTSQYNLLRRKKDGAGEGVDLFL